MNDFLDLIESIEAREFRPEFITRDDPAYGANVTRFRRTRADDPRYRRALRECARLLNNVRAGITSDHVLREALTTSDFPLLFGDIIDRAMLGAYNEWPYTWANIVRRATVRDFRTVKRFYLNGGEAILAQVKETEEYPAASLADGSYTYAVKKYGRRMPFSWETIINDDMDALTDVPNRFARAARRSEERFVTTLYAGASGPLNTVYTVGNKNIVNATNAGAGFTAINPPLSVNALQQALVVLAKMVDADSEPIMIDAVELVVPPALEITALTILNALQLEYGLVGQGQAAAPAAETRVVTTNWLRNRLRLNVNPYLPIVSTSNGDTSWYLFASSRSGRPAIEFAFLRGYETPQIFMKSPNAVRVGGGNVDPMQGDFDNDTIDYKIRHVFGGAVMDPKMTVASNGTGA